MIKKVLLVLIFAMNTYSNNQQNFFGSVGKFYAPTARFNDVGTLSMNVNYSENFSRVNFLAQPYDWLEISLFYADIPSKPFSASLDQSYKDKGFNFKIRLQDESKHKPELAVGLSDFAGTGLFSGEFFVASKKINNLDISVGIGWGIYGGFYDFKNPFRLLDSEFDNRNENFDFVGEIDTNDFFSGGEASIFWFGFLCFRKK